MKADTCFGVKRCRTSSTPSADIIQLLNETSFKIFKEFVSDEFLSAGVEKYKKVYGEN